MNSEVVTGKVWHARFHPVKHSFEYPVYFFKLDLDELSRLSKVFFGFSLNGWNILSLREKEYLRPSSEALRAKVEALLLENQITEKPARIELVTQMRYFGWVFNPVSFFFCWGARGNLFAVIADVNNTFGEGHAYVLKEFRALESNRLEAKTPKVFHVSPFFERKVEYLFEFIFNPGSVNIILDYFENDQLRLASSWRGQCHPFGQKEVLAVLCRYPFAGWLTVIRIHLQASVLYFIKKLPIFKKPEPANVMTIRKQKKDAR